MNGLSRTEEKKIVYLHLLFKENLFHFARFKLCSTTSHVNALL